MEIINSLTFIILSMLSISVSRSGLSTKRDIIFYSELDLF
jgi:hypothetical protein